MAVAHFSGFRTGAARVAATTSANSRGHVEHTGKATGVDGVVCSSYVLMSTNPTLYTTQVATSQLHRRFIHYIIASVRLTGLPRVDGHLTVGRTGGNLGHKDAAGAMCGRGRACTPAT